MGVPPYAVPSRLALSSDERAAYRRLADALLQTALKDFAAFTVDNPARRVSPMDWKLVKTQDGISVYKERHPPTARKDAPFVPRLLTADGRFERVDANISVPTMLVTGTMHGTVDDAIHGAFIDSPESHATRGYYINDRSSDFRVLARIDAPSESDPYRFCGLAWTEMGGAGVPFVKRRDLLTLIASGMVTMADTGERMGYYMIHSISHPILPPLTEHKLMRAKCSFTYLFRQQPNGMGSHVETYQKGFFAPLGDVPERGVVAAVVRTLICPSRLVDAGNNRKLAFLLQHARPGKSRATKSRAGSRDELTSEDGDHTDDDDESNCAGGCARRRSDSFFSSSGGSPFSSSGGPLRKLTQHAQSHGVCVICKLKVCGSCKVVKKMVVDATGYEIEIKSVGFCLVCVNKAKMLSAPMLARQELAEKRGLVTASSPLFPPTPASVDARPSPAPSPNYIRSPQIAQPRLLRTTSWDISSGTSALGTDDGYATRLRSALEKPKVERKTSWSGVTTSFHGGSRSRAAGTGPTARSPHVDNPRVPRKTSWVGSDASSTKSVKDDGSSETVSGDKPQPDRKTSWVGVERRFPSVLSRDKAPVTKMRSPPPPPPSRRPPHTPTVVNSTPEPSPKPISPGAADTAPRKRAPPPERPRRQTPSFAGLGTATESVRTERRVASPTGGIFLLPTPTQDKQSPSATTPSRQRRDERSAIEEIARRGILL